MIRLAPSFTGKGVKVLLIDTAAGRFGVLVDGAGGELVLDSLRAGIGAKFKPGNGYQVTQD